VCVCVSACIIDDDGQSAEVRGKEGEIGQQVGERERECVCVCVCVCACICVCACGREGA